MSMLHRVEEYDTTLGENSLRLSFETKGRGYWQCWYDEDGLYECEGEPSYYTLTREEQRKVEEISAIVFRMVFPDER